MKHQTLFSSKDKSKKNNEIKMSSAAILLGPLRVNTSRIFSFLADLNSPVIYH